MRDLNPLPCFVGRFAVDRFTQVHLLSRPHVRTMQITKWERRDSNPRRPKSAGLQPAPIATRELSHINLSRVSISDSFVVSIRHRANLSNLSFKHRQFFASNSFAGIDQHLPSSAMTKSTSQSLMFLFFTVLNDWLPPITRKLHE